MKILFRIAKFILISVYVVSGVLLAVFLIPRTGWKARTVATSSMSPAIPQGALVIIHRVPYSTIKPNDVITFINPANPRQTVTHRVVKTGIQVGLPSFTTKGDSNPTTDREILGGNVVGKVVLHSRKAGAVVHAVRRPIGFGLLIIIPALLIIIDEIRILRRALGPQPVKPKSLEPADRNPKPVARKKRGIDSIGRVVIPLALVTFVVGGTRATLTSSATLTGNTIVTAAGTSHVLINRIDLGTDDDFCPALPSDISISGTGPGSINQIIIESHCEFSFISTTHVSVINSNHQTAETGDASGSGATSGDASNSNSTTTIINIDNGGQTGDDGQTVELYNPTNQPINLLNWSLTDDSGLRRLLRNRTLPAHGFLTVHGRIGNELTGTGDRLVLKNTGLTAVDGASWGTDHSVLNPAIPAIPDGGAIIRKALGLDTDSASDWQLEP